MDIAYVRVPPVKLARLGHPTRSLIAARGSLHVGDAKKNKPPPPPGQEKKKETTKSSHYSIEREYVAGEL